MFVLALAVLFKRVFKVTTLCPLEEFGVDFCFQHGV